MPEWQGPPGPRWNRAAIRPAWRHNGARIRRRGGPGTAPPDSTELLRCADSAPAPCDIVRRLRRDGRSEEHTSELQSLRHLVCRLLLEKTIRREEHTCELQSLRQLECRLLLDKKS